MKRFLTLKSFKDQQICIDLTPIILVTTMLEEGKGLWIELVTNQNYHQRYGYVTSEDANKIVKYFSESEEFCGIDNLEITLVASNETILKLKGSIN